jgi:ribosome modulation factor
MNANEFHLWLEGFRAAGGDPLSPRGREAIEHMLAEEEPDPLCPECTRRVRQQWLDLYLRYYADDTVGA